MLDGEEPGMSAGRAREHAIGCPRCSAFLVGATELHRRVRVRSVEDATYDAELTASVAIAAGHRTASERWRGLAARALLIMIALGQLAISAPALLFGDDREAPLHVAHEIGSFSVAIAVGLLVAAARPRLASGMFPLVAIMSGLLVMTAGTDLGEGSTGFADEAPHLLVVASCAVLWWISKRPDMTEVEPSPSNRHSWRRPDVRTMHDQAA
jgi:predicted anti-sigma-YlaC factor YlaD